jgi:transposase
VRDQPSPDFNPIKVYLQLQGKEVDCWRSKYLCRPLRMGDGLAANWSCDDERIEYHCLVHARHKFWEIA